MAKGPAIAPDPSCVIAASRDADVSQPVSRVLEGLHGSHHADVTAIPLGRGLLRASSNLPGRRVRHDPAGLSSEDELSAVPSLFGFAPGGVCHAASVAGDAVRSYRTFSPLPRHPCGGVAVRSLWHFP
ncbi:hypothetical protein CRBSH125_11470 [Afipia carboxidovorans]|nr:hypothetical protein CRBSH125_11470 [Afipia carboxidovorans]